MSNNTKIIDSINDVELMDLNDKIILDVSGKRKVNYRKIAILIFAVTLSAFQIYTAIFGSFEGILQRMLHAFFAIPLLFLIFPMGKKKKDPRPQPKIWLAYDILLIVLSLSSVYYFISQYSRLVTRMAMASPVYQLDIIFGIIVIYVVLATARRSVGMAMPVLALVFVVYALFGKNMPGILMHQGLSFPRYIDTMVLYVEGIWGAAIGVISTYVFLFILFGAFLEMTGGGKFFIDLAYAVTGRSAGGPAKAAVVSSALMGTISGSAVANVVTTGTFTIPMMKKSGYKSHFAAAVEATASAGGQLMPPVMGAGAFLIAEFAGVPYAQVMLVSIIPALLYFSNVFINVHLEAKKLGLEGMPTERLPQFKKVMKEGWYNLLPIIILVLYLILGYSPMKAGANAIITTTVIWIITSLLNKGEQSWRKVFFDMGNQFIKTMERGAVNALPVIAACLTAGIIIGCISMTGLAIKFSSLLISFADGRIWMALIMITFASFILGMGLPTTTAYILLAVLAVPALRFMGVPVLVGHMIVFWLSQSSHVTPPVCVAAYAAAGIADANPIKTAFVAMRLGICIYAAPYIYAYTPILLRGTVLEVTWATIVAFIGLATISIAFEGFFTKHINIIERLIAGVGGLLTIVPERYTEIIGLILIAVFTLMQLMKKKGYTSTAALK